MAERLGSGNQRGRHRERLSKPNDMSEEIKLTHTTGRPDGLPASFLFAPFYRAAIPDDASAMPDILISHLAQVAEKLGYREGKEGTTIPPVEWCEEGLLQNKMRAAWVRGCQSGMRVRANDPSELPTGRGGDGHHPRQQRPGG